MGQPDRKHAIHYAREPFARFLTGLPTGHGLVEDADGRRFVPMDSALQIEHQPDPPAGDSIVPFPASPKVED